MGGTAAVAALVGLVGTLVIRVLVRARRGRGHPYVRHGQRRAGGAYQTDGRHASQVAGDGVAAGVGAGFEAGVTWMYAGLLARMFPGLGDLTFEVGIAPAFGLYAVLRPQRMRVR